MIVIIDGKEYVEKSLIENWLHGGFFPDLQNKFERVEQALGFRLFRWQKSYIAMGEFRCYGKTTAECLRMLWEVTADPLDFTKPPISKRDVFFRKTMKEIQEKLVSAGIPTRTVFWCIADKKKYDYMQTVDFERQLYDEWLVQNQKPL